MFNTGEVVSYPVRRSASKRDVLLCSTQCSGETLINAEPTASLRADKDLSSGSVLYCAAGRQVVKSNILCCLLRSL